MTATQVKRRRKDLESLLAASGGPGNELAEVEIGGDLGDEALSRSMRDLVALSLHDRSLRRRQINAALKRLDSGDYGVCSECGEAIAAARLKAVPWAAACVRCQQALEEEEDYVETLEAANP